MSTSEQEPQDGLVLDEAFIAAATIKEPSARRRAGNPVSRRRAARRARRAQRAAAGPGSRHGGRYAPLGAVALVLVAGVGAAALYTLDQRGGGWRDQSAGAAGDATESAPGGSGTALRISINDPFAGSPAERFPDGEAGITLPRVRAMGGLSRVDVGKLQRQVRDLLVAGQLNRHTLLDGDPDAFARALDAEQRPQFLKELDLRDPRKRTRPWLMSFARGSVSLAGPVIKVQGTMKTSPVKQYGRSGVRVKVNYLFVYPIHRPGEPSTLTRMVAHVEGELFGYREAGALHGWLVDWGHSATPVDCTTRDGFVHPDYPEGTAPNGATPTGKPQDPYDPAPESRLNGCERSLPT